MKKQTKTKDVVKKNLIKGGKPTKPGSGHSEMENICRDGDGNAYSSGAVLNGKVCRIHADVTGYWQ